MLGPINLELVGSEAVRPTGLPTGIVGDRANEVNLIALLTGDNSLPGDITVVDQMVVGQ